MLCRSRSLVLLLLAAVAAVAQFRQDPIDAAIQDYYRLRNAGHHEEAALKREEIRALVDQAPVEAPQFTNWFQQVTQIYRQAGKTVEVRAIAQAALARGNRLPDADATRVMLLTALADSWLGDGSLLRAEAYLEQAAAANTRPAAINGRFLLANPASVNQQLADLYRQLGRPDAAASALARAESRLKNDPFLLASFYDRQGQVEEAEAVYNQIANQTRNPQDDLNALQSLANLYLRDARPEDAAEAQERAIGMAQNSSNSGNQTFWMRWNLASYLQQAHRNQQAEQVYQQLLSDPRGDQLQAVAFSAGFLRSTNRAGQAEKLLTGYLDSHSDLDAGQAANLLNTLASMVSDPQRAAEYRRAAAAKMPNPFNPPNFPPNSIQETLRSAQQAANQGRLDEAFSLSLEAIAAAPMAPDRDSIGNWLVPSIADTIGRKQPAKAEEIYRSLLAATEGWTADTIQPLIQTSRAYVQFLMGRPDRQEDVPAAIERYRAVLAAARGADAAAADTSDFAINFERAHASWDRALFLAEERLRLEESLSGTTSRPYMGALGTLVNLYEARGDPERALPLHRQMVAIADLTAGPNDPQPAQIRMNAAVAFARQRQFEEADRLAAEAQAIEKAMRHPTGNFTWQLTEIQRLEKAAAQKAAAQ